MTNKERIEELKNIILQNPDLETKFVVDGGSIYSVQFNEVEILEISICNWAEFNGDFYTDDEPFGDIEELIDTVYEHRYYWDEPKEEDFFDKEEFKREINKYKHYYMGMAERVASFLTRKVIRVRMGI